MPTYAIYEPPLPANDIETRVDELVFVKEGFSLPAFVLGPFWLLARRLWLPFVLALISVAVLVGLARLLPGGAGALGMVWLLAAAAFAFEADGIRRWSLERDGFTLLGTVSGHDRDACEQRFLTGWLAALGARATGATSANGATSATLATSPMHTPPAGLPHT